MVGPNLTFFGHLPRVTFWVVWKIPLTILKFHQRPLPFELALSINFMKILQQKLILIYWHKLLYIWNLKASNLKIEMSNNQSPFKFKNRVKQQSISVWLDFFWVHFQSIYKVYIYRPKFKASFILLFLICDFFGLRLADFSV